MHVEGEDGWTIIATGIKHNSDSQRKKKNIVVGVSQVQYDSTVLANHENALSTSMTLAKVNELV